jgi:hypothetical protein
MSAYTYAGPYKNPTAGMFVKEVGDLFYIFIRSDRAPDGSAGPDRPHTRHGRDQTVLENGFEEAEDAEEWIAQTSEFFDRDHEQYCEENHADIARMEAYEAFRNEY